MTGRQRRNEPQRYSVSKECRGRGTHVQTGRVLEFRGIDVSIHGFGCVIVGEVLTRDVISLNVGGHLLKFEVMWVESHLGIENNYRVGLHCIDQQTDVRGQMQIWGVVTVPMDD
jgi:hypothetical protein